MSTYTSTPAVVNKPISEMYARFNDLRFFEEQLAQLPEDRRAALGEVHFDADSITIVTPQVGNLTFAVVERIEPTKVVFGSPSSPVPLSLSVNFKEVNPDSTEITAVMDVEIPAMLRPFVGPKLQQAADQFGQMITNLAK